MLCGNSASSTADLELLRGLVPECRRRRGPARPRSPLGPSDGAEVEPPCFLGGAFGGAGSGVADEHVAAGPAGDGHESGFGAAGGEPAVGGGVPEPVGSEALHSGSLGAAP